MDGTSNTYSRAERLPLPPIRTRGERIHAQSNCRRTLEALAKLHQPRERFIGPAEVRAIDPHAVEDDTELARQCDPRFLRAAPLGDRHGPGLEAREADGACQHHTRRLVERGAHHPIADLGDAPGDVDLA